MALWTRMSSMILCVALASVMQLQGCTGSSGGGSGGSILQDIENFVVSHVKLAAGVCDAGDVLDCAEAAFDVSSAVVSGGSATAAKFAAKQAAIRAAKSAAGAAMDCSGFDFDSQVKRKGERGAKRRKKGKKELKEALNRKAEELIDEANGALDDDGENLMCCMVGHMINCAAPCCKMRDETLLSKTIEFFTEGFRKPFEELGQELGCYTPLEYCEDGSLIPPEKVEELWGYEVDETAVYAEEALDEDAQLEQKRFRCEYYYYDFSRATPINLAFGDKPYLESPCSR